MTDFHLSAMRQIAAHIGGMALAIFRHKEINFRFHWSGICRAISSVVASLERGSEKSGASPIVFNPRAK